MNNAFCFINAFAIAEKLSALMTEAYLAERAARGSRTNYLAALAQVPDVEPEEYERLPSSKSMQSGDS